MISEYKRAALDRLRGNWGIEIAMLSILFAISIFGEIFVDDTEFIPVILFSLLTGVISMGYSKHVLDRVNGKEESKILDIFVYFTTIDVLFLFGLNLLVGLFTFLWSLLFIIPGIIASLSYSMALYIKMENPEIGALEAIKMSQKITDGHKLEIFLLPLSFIGWFILGIVTIVGLIPVTAYLTYATLEQYKDLMSSIKNGEIGRASCRERV